MTLTYGELFAGVGGFSIGFDQAGWTPKFQVEWDAHCQQTLRYHWPDVPKWGDVSEVSGFDLPPVDLIAFGSPCQDLSVAGKRAGLEGERSGLFHEAIRIINEMKEATGGQYPRWVVWENVAGAFSSGRGDDFETVLKEMGNLGCHHLEWHCLDAQFFGVPQRRRRVFVVACLDSRILGRGGTEIFPVGEGRRRNPAKGNKTGQEVAGTLGGGSGSRGWSPDTDRMTFIPGDEPQVVDAVTAKWAKGSGGPAGDECQNMVVEPIPIQGTIIGRQDHNGPAGKGYGEEGDPMYTLDSISQHAVATPFVKSRRAQNPNDDETWVGDAPSPTLNAFDNTGESRATVLIPLMFENSYRDGPRIGNGEVSNTLHAKMGTGGNNVPFIATDVEGSEVAATLRGFGHGWQGQHNSTNSIVQPTLRVEESGMAVAYDEYNDTLGGDTHHALRAGTRQSTGVLVEVPELYQSDMEEQIVYEPMSMGDENWAERNVKNALRAGASKSSHAITTRVPVEAAGFKPGASADARSIGYQEGISPSLEAGGGGNNRPAILAPTMHVRRLTPLECERLMGWPDNHTLHRADNKNNSDTTRYKMCGNGVASPVAAWLAHHINQAEQGINQ